MSAITFQLLSIGLINNNASIQYIWKTTGIWHENQYLTIFGKKLLLLKEGNRSFTCQMIRSLISSYYKGGIKTSKKHLDLHIFWLLKLEKNSSKWQIDCYMLLNWRDSAVMANTMLMYSLKDFQECSEIYFTYDRGKFELGQYSTKNSF